MKTLYCDKCKLNKPIDDFNDPEIIRAKKGDRAMCGLCQKGWNTEKNGMDKKYKVDVEKEREKYINKS